MHNTFSCLNSKTYLNLIFRVVCKQWKRIIASLLRVAPIARSLPISTQQFILKSDFKQLLYATGGVIALLYEDRLALLRLESPASVTAKYQLRFDWQFEFSNTLKIPQESLGTLSCFALGPFVVSTWQMPHHRIVIDTRDHSLHTISNIRYNISYDDFDTSILLVPSWISGTRSIDPNTLPLLLQSEGIVYRYHNLTKQTEPLYSFPQDLLNYVPKCSAYMDGQQVAHNEAPRPPVLPELITVQIYVYGTRVAVSLKNASRLRNNGEAVLLHYELIEK